MSELGAEKVQNRPPPPMSMRKRPIYPPRPCQLASGNPCGACTALQTFDTDAFLSWNWIRERQLLLRRVNGRHDPLTYYLPFELISQIFEIYHDDTGYPDSVLSRTIPISRTSPLRLAAVCTTWRDIAFDIPSLWSSLGISYSPSWFVEQWLDRSKAKPLSIRIVLPQQGENAMELKTIMVDTLRRYADRWKLLNLLMTTELSRRLLSARRFVCTPLLAPLLENLQLEIADENFETMPRIVCLDAPRLKKLQTWRICLPTLKIQWDNLTSVRVVMPSIDEVFAILARSPHLVEYDLEDTCEDSSVYPIPAHITHPSLLSLRICPKNLAGPDDIDTMFERLTFPVLKCLTYNFESSVPLNMEIFCGFLMRTIGTMTCLSLEEIDFDCISQSSIITVLELLPSLIELNLECWKSEAPCIAFLESFCAHLAGVQSYNRFLANLQILAYRGLKHNVDSWKSLKYALKHLASALENPSLFSGADEEMQCYTPRPLNTVHFTLINRSLSKDIVSVPEDVFTTFSRIKKRAATLMMVEQMWNEDGTKDDLDLIQHWLHSDVNGFLAL